MSIPNDIISFNPMRFAVTKTSLSEKQKRDALGVFSQWAIDVSTLGELADLESRMDAIGVDLQQVGEWSATPAPEPQPEVTAEPVAWRYRFPGGTAWTLVTHEPVVHGSLLATIEPLYATPPVVEEAVKAERIGPDEAVAELFVDAWTEAEKAMRKFPQPNYVISKVAEEAGEVVKAAIHCAEGRDTPQHVAEEIRQAMAMLIRLYIEGDQVHGLPPVASALSARSATP